MSLLLIQVPDLQELRLSSQYPGAVGYPTYLERNLGRTMISIGLGRTKMDWHAQECRASSGIGIIGFRRDVARRTV